MATPLAVLLCALSKLDTSTRSISKDIAIQLHGLKTTGTQIHPLPLFSLDQRSTLNQISAHLSHLSECELEYFLNGAEHGPTIHDGDRTFTATIESVAKLDACQTDYVRSIANGMLGSPLIHVSVSSLPSFASLQGLTISALQNVLVALHFMSSPQLQDILESASRHLKTLQATSTANRILGLPAELQSRIYEAALISPFQIPVARGAYNKPALLQTCRQIRRDASSIYYHDNFFEIVAVDLSMSVALTFSKQAGNFLDVERVRVRWLKMEPHESWACIVVVLFNAVKCHWPHRETNHSNWSAFMDCLRRYFEGEMFCLRLFGNIFQPQLQAQLVSTSGDVLDVGLCDRKYCLFAFESTTMLKHSGRTWTQAKVILEVLMENQKFDFGHDQVWSVQCNGWEPAPEEMSMTLAGVQIAPSWDYEAQGYEARFGGKQ